MFLGFLCGAAAKGHQNPDELCCRDYFAPGIYEAHVNEWHPSKDRFCTFKTQDKNTRTAWIDISKTSATVAVPNEMLWFKNFHGRKLNVVQLRNLAKKNNRTIKLHEILVDPELGEIRFVKEKSGWLWTTRESKCWEFTERDLSGHSEESKPNAEKKFFTDWIRTLLKRDGFQFSNGRECTAVEASLLFGFARTWCNVKRSFDKKSPATHYENYRDDIVAKLVIQKAESDFVAKFIEEKKAQIALGNGMFNDEDWYTAPIKDNAGRLLKAYKDIMHRYNLDESASPLK